MFAIVVFAVDNAHEYVIPVMLDAAFKKYCSGKWVFLFSPRKGYKGQAFE